jgi:hypothetical protein
MFSPNLLKVFKIITNRQNGLVIDKQTILNPLKEIEGI